MKTLFRKLRSVTFEDSTLLKHSTNRVALLTGLSSYENSQLSPHQLDFLSYVVTSDFETVSCNFPYHSDFLRTEYKATNLVSASLRNVSQFLCCRFHKMFPQLVARPLQLLLDQTEQRLVLITGSCGFELWRAAQPYLYYPKDLQVRVISLGPVSWSSKGTSAKIYQGQRDWISRLFGPRLAWSVHTLNGHMNYYSDSMVRDSIRRDIASFIQP